MSDKAEQFNKWYKEHTGHPSQINFAYEVIKELSLKVDLLNDVQAQNESAVRRLERQAATIGELLEKLEQYKSTPEQAFKSVMEFHEYAFVVRCTGAGNITAELKPRFASGAIAIKGFNMRKQQFIQITSEDINP